MDAPGTRVLRARHRPRPALGWRGTGSPRPAGSGRTVARERRRQGGASGLRQMEVTVHGYRRAFVTGGRGPVVVLVHGIGDSAATWMEVLERLSRTHTVVAPDLLGHGRSDKPRADYSVGAYANGLRDLLTILGVERATVVGHSLGGGVVAQFAYQFPDRCERLVLVSTGGVGRAVHPVLRLAAVPGAEVVLPALGLPGAGAVVGAAGALARASGILPSEDVEGITRALRRLPDTGARRALVRTLRAAVDWRGQCITMLDRAYLAEGMPTLVVWGRRDGIIPFGHAVAVHRAMPGSRLEVFEHAGHFPHRTDPDRFVATLRAFMATSPSAEHDPSVWRERLQAGRRPPAARATTGQLALDLSPVRAPV